MMPQTQHISPLWRHYDRSREALIDALSEVYEGDRDAATADADERLREAIREQSNRQAERLRDLQSRTKPE